MRWPESSDELDNFPVSLQFSRSFVFSLFFCYFFHVLISGFFSLYVPLSLFSLFSPTLRLMALLVTDNRMRMARGRGPVKLRDGAPHANFFGQSKRPCMTIRLRTVYTHCAHESLGSTETCPLPSPRLSRPSPILCSSRSTGPGPVWHQEHPMFHPHLPMRC